MKFMDEKKSIIHFEEHTQDFLGGEVKRFFFLNRKPKGPLGGLPWSRRSQMSPFDIDGLKGVRFGINNLKRVLFGMEGLKGILFDIKYLKGILFGINDLKESFWHRKPLGILFGIEDIKESFLP